MPFLSLVFPSYSLLLIHIILTSFPRRMMEAWELYRSGLFADNTINDLLYGLPLSLANLSDISSLQDELDALPRDEGVQGGKIRVMVDNVKQVEAIEAFMRDRSLGRTK
jgi:hypothetical protein